MAHLVDFDLSPTLVSQIADLLSTEGNDRFEEFLHVDTFDEVPLYSRFSQLSFLGDRPVEDQNAVLIKAAAVHLTEIIKYVEGRGIVGPKQYAHMVSITGWDSTDEAVCSDGWHHLLIPNFWYGDLAHPLMQSFVMTSPSTPCSRFVARALQDSPEFQLFESGIEVAYGPCPRRVYIDWEGRVSASIERRRSEPLG